jgi:RNA polymerase-binding transcription factor DksA
MVGKVSEPARRYEGLLRERRESLLRDLSALDEERRTEGENASGIPMHPADLGSDSVEYDVIRSCAETATSELQEIDEALARIREGTFGLCEDCGRPIPAARLEAIPYARLCISCKSQEEAA